MRMVCGAAARIFCTNENADSTVVRTTVSRDSFAFADCARTGFSGNGINYFICRFSVILKTPNHLRIVPKSLSASKTACFCAPPDDAYGTNFSELFNRRERRERRAEKLWRCLNLQAERGSVTRSGLIRNAACGGAQSRAPKLGHGNNFAFLAFSAVKSTAP